MIPDWLFSINTAAWVISNLLVGYIFVALVAFLIGYFILFDPFATTAGSLFFTFALSLAGVMLLVSIGVFVDPRGGAGWYDFPGDTAVWRPLFRLIVYGSVALAVTRLINFVIKRKWYPHRLRTARDLQLLRARHEKDNSDVT